VVEVLSYPELRYACTGLSTFYAYGVEKLYNFAEKIFTIKKNVMHPLSPIYAV
jgi:hypothetical protein